MKHFKLSFEESALSKENQQQAEDFLSQLNPQQQKAASRINGPVLIVAGAGSGKTRVLTYRIAYMLASGSVSRSQILALTFTNKAAKEMRQRIEGLIGDDARFLWMGTFHSIFARILRKEAELLGYTSDFSIYDSDDSQRLIKNIITDLGINSKEIKPKQIHYKISSAKNALVGPEEYGNKFVQSSLDDIVNQVYGRYVAGLQANNAMDFDDLLIKPITLFTQHSEVLEQYQDRFRYILIDEYQDTNHAQYKVTKLLASKYQNLCVVGDDAQSIYSFRGADIGNILDFKSDYPEALEIPLEQNYRSTKVILKTADSIIKNNKKQLEKSLWTENEPGKPVVVIESQSDRDEAKKVVSFIHHYRLQYGYQNKDFAILYRTNFQSRLFEDALRFKNIAYQIVGGVSFYQRKEVKDVLAYLTLLVNSQDNTSLLRIINEPARGIGDKTIDAVREFAERENLTLWEALQDVEKINLRSAAKIAIRKFVQSVDSVRSELDEKTLVESTQTLLERTEYMKQYNEDNSDESIDRRSNVLALLDAIAQHEEQNPDSSLSTFLQEVTLLTDADELDESTSRVTLMTMHAAKGLEFPVVFVVGLEEDLFPIAGRAGEDTDIEEERRLFYVAITRAEKELFFSYSKNRYRFGTETRMMRSRFLEEADPTMMVMENGANFKSKSLSTRSQTVVDRQDYVDESWKQSKATGGRAASSRIHLEPTGIEDFQVGVEVFHQKFGEGKIQHLEGQGADSRVTVFFPSVGQKKLLLRFAKLSILG